MRKISLCASLLFVVAVCSGADWLQFRGTQSVAEKENPPASWTTDENVAWKVDLPGRGPSGPILVKGNVIVTCSGGVNQDRLYVISCSAETGEENWRREFWATGRTNTHPSSAVAANTPASDGERIYAFFSSNDLVCLDLEGNLLWYRGLTFDYPKSGNDVGMSSSPAVVDGVVIVQIESQGDSFAAGIDALTGETLWRKERGRTANWTSPVVIPARGQRPATVLMQSPSGLTIVDPRSGDVKWEYEIECSGIPSVATDGEWLYVPADGITAFKLAEDSTSPELVWNSGRLNPSAASPVLYQEKLYVLNRAGVITCADVKDEGEQLWQLRLKGSFWATPVIAGGRMYCLGSDGDCQVVQLGEKGEVLSTNPIEEKIQGSPAVGEDALYFRTDAHLWKIASP
ncbi:outer membrane protein assembly factor BamB family protein [Lignipirellula cremea]|uniref:Outer membrane biogenesis protein BamB n=1 Tax=Lignipirellula cremea TaxID=2528010 RepID=A0A518DTV8_9BACT|nr:PQQ-binding-like beta-propeller repeat protein [Lignipirellula cremea]QDU95264.1 outer membrane biogenesis protein BamB [Lignipirellula cremea]